MMGSTQDGWGWGCDDDDDSVSVIGDKGEIGFIDFQYDQSVVKYNPDEEGPVVISVPFAVVNGRPQSVFVGETAVNPISITNNTDEAIDLRPKIFASNPENSFTLSVIKPPADEREGIASGFKEFCSLKDRIVRPGDTLTIWLLCKPTEIGLCTCVVHFDVDNVRTERVVFLLAEDRISQSLASRTPFSRGSRKKQFSVERYVIGSRPQKATNRPFKNKLPRYGIPKDLRETIESKQIPEVVARGLSRETYEFYFKALIVMEEIQMEENMRAYNMEGVSMRRRAGFLTLEVPGLAERRPSLVHGDDVFVKSVEASETDPPFQGFIHRVEADEVYLKFASKFHSRHKDRNLYNVNFTYDRNNMRRLYQAIDATINLDSEILFPSSSRQRRCIDTTPLVPISCSINEEQMLAIEMILGLKGGSPYLIHGPPGTGKTMTIVEAILQLYINRKNVRILVCAPSNGATDYLLEKILSEEAIDIKENEIFRLNASSRPLEDVKPEHIRYCFFDEHIFKCPPLPALRRYRIIISTYMSASLLHAKGLKRGHFSHIFLDEAGQASEPDSMVPISNLCGKKTAVILSGDPMQLGPVVYSRVAEARGLGKSYLERLFGFKPYRDEDKNYITKLVRNYRSHPDILSLPSSLFYKGELIACRESTEETTDLLSSVNLIPGNNFPVIFFGIQGCDEREGSNPSWFNRIEASKVVDVVWNVIERGGLNDGDVGVITPYRQQVLKINKVLENLDMPDIKVGSVEQFQGQERKVIIISTVRSTAKYNMFDRLHCLGFLSNPKRLNVAITRAMSLLIIIGNPHIISKDPNWHKVLWYCVDNNSYQGCDLPERQDCDLPEGQEHQHKADEDNQREACVDDWTNNEGESSSSYAEVQSQIENNQIPGTHEAEWSDGWK